MVLLLETCILCASYLYRANFFAEVRHSLINDYFQNLAHSHNSKWRKTVGRNMNVILGGGRAHFLPITQKELSGEPGKRLDGKNLIKEWQQLHESNGFYVQTKQELLQLSNKTEHVLGLFAANHMPFHLDADANTTPTLSELVSVALEILQRKNNGKGYFLFVEGGRIDHAHHKTLAMKALDETAEFAKAIELTRESTSLEDTLIVVTSDHSHTMSVAGYSSRKNDIFGIILRPTVPLTNCVAISVHKLGSPLSLKTSASFSQLRLAT